MAKKSKLLAALDAQKGRDHNLERQKKLQRQAVKRKKARPQAQSTEPEIENEKGTKVDIPVNGTDPQLKEDSEGWESDGSEDALSPTVGWSYAPESPGGTKHRQLIGGVALDGCVQD